MNNPNTISQILKNQIKQATGVAIDKYLNIPVDERQKLESQGINISNFVYDHILPIVNNIMIKDILVVIEEGIGNMVMLTPALRMMRHINPRLNITVLCREPAAQVIRGWEVVDKVITEFDNNYYDVCIYTIWSSNTKKNYGQIIQQHCKGVFSIELRTYHEISQQMDVAEFFSGRGDLCETHCEIANGFKIDLKKYIVFANTTLRHFGWDRKRWPYYKELAEKIYKKFPEKKIVLVGDKEDKKDYEKIEWPENVVLDFCGEINIPQLAYLIKNAELFVGNDSGPAHISASVGTKTFAIFGATRLGKNLPVGKDVHIINKPMWCSPCQYTERWEQCGEYNCMSQISADEVYDKIFHSDKVKTKKKCLLVGDFSEGALRNEIYIKERLEKDFSFKVFPFAYRDVMKKMPPILTTYEIVSEVLQKGIDLVLICGGQNLVPEIFKHLNFLSPKTKIFNWYVDCRGNTEGWFRNLCSYCHSSFWSVGDPKLLSEVFSQTQKPCQFLPITPDDNYYFPLNIEKEYDVIFCGTPHSQERVQLLEYLVNSGINITIFGDGNWPDSLKPHTKPGVFGKDFNTLLNKSKIIVNQNVINEVPLYFSDRYFYPMAVNTVGLNKRIPNIEDMFEDGKHMVLWDTYDDCAVKIKELLGDDKKREEIGKAGFELYKEKYTLKHMMERILNEYNLF